MPPLAPLIQSTITADAAPAIIDRASVAAYSFPSNCHVADHEANGMIAVLGFEPVRHAAALH